MGKECRICLERGEGKLIAPCGCKGTGKWIHTHCLKRWRRMNSDQRCSICRKTYKLSKLQKHHVRPMYRIHVPLPTPEEREAALAEKEFRDKIVIIIVYIIFIIATVLFEFERQKLEAAGEWEDKKGWLIFIYLISIFTITCSQPH